MTRCRSVSIRSVTWFRWWKASSIQRETLLPDETNEVSDSSTQPPRLSACTFVKPGHLSPLSLLLLPSSKQCKCHRSPDVLPQVQNVWKDVGTFLVNVPSKTFISLKNPACWSLFYQASPVSLGSRISVVSKCAGQKKIYRHYIGAHIVILWNIFLSSQVPMQSNQNPLVEFRIQFTKRLEKKATFTAWWLLHNPTWWIHVQNADDLRAKNPQRKTH